MVLIHEKEKIVEFWNSINGESIKRLYTFIEKRKKEDLEFHISSFVGEYDVEDESVVKTINGQTIRSFIGWMYGIEDKIKTKEDLDFFFKSSEENYKDTARWVSLYRKMYKDFVYPIKKHKEIEVYRGSAQNKKGISWTLDKNIALCFADLEEKNIQTLKIKTNDKRILCYFDNVEKEILLNL